MTLDELYEQIGVHLYVHGDKEVAVEFKGGVFSEIKSIGLNIGSIEDWGDGVGGFIDGYENTHAAIEFDLK